MNATTPTSVTPRRAHYYRAPPCQRAPLHLIWMRRYGPFPNQLSTALRLAQIVNHRPLPVSRETLELRPPWYHAPSLQRAPPISPISTYLPYQAPIGDRPSPTSTHEDAFQTRLSQRQAGIAPPQTQPMKENHTSLIALRSYSPFRLPRWLSSDLSTNVNRPSLSHGEHAPRQARPRMPPPTHEAAWSISPS